jgi:hypothetical protein
MIILWVRKVKAEERKDSSRNDKESFEKHDDIMKKFRFSHPEREIKIVAPKDILTTDGNLLAPVNSVTLGVNKQN